MAPKNAWGKWHCPCCTAEIAANPYVKSGVLEVQMHIAAHVDANDDYLMGLI